jgi:hypothetical protein
VPWPRRPHRASPDEIKISREGDNAIIQYADDTVATTYYRLGRERLATMTDEDILADWNDHIDARDEFMRTYEYVAVEVPVGRPQLDRFEEGDHWVPRGHVLRCVVHGSTGEAEEPFLTIDDRDFTPVEFAKMVSTFGGWGMRLVFVPDNALHEEPAIEVREPEPRGTR